MGLKEILQLIGASEPFDDNGNYTEAGLVAKQILVKIAGGLECIGALGKTGDELENYLDEIVRMGY